MKKFLKWAGIIIISLFILLFGAFKVMQYNTKKKSPEVTAEYSKNDTKISVFYCSPSKRGRVIFDSLVPYGEVWRTGANEPTTFTTNKDIDFGGKSLKAGKYTLWTIPEKETWTVILNSKEYGWGVTFGGVAAREPEADVLQVQVPAQRTENIVEQFTITFEEESSLKMVMEWDQTSVDVPIKY